MMLHIKRWIITLFILFGIIAGLGFIKYSQVMAAMAFGESFPEPSETVETINSTVSQWRPKLEIVGEVRARRTLEVRNELDGMITKIGFGSGALVKKGDLLIQQDIGTEQAQLAAINAQIELAKLDVARFEDLVAKRAGSQEQLDRAKAELKVQQANARALETTIDRKTIRSPFDGRTSIHEWEAGTFLSGDSHITTLIGDTSKVWVDFSVPQRYANVTTGDLVTVVAKDNYPRALEAEVSAINSQIVTDSRSLQVRATLDNRLAELKPGSMVAVLMPIAQPTNVIRLPNEALRFDTFGSYVYVLEKDQEGKYRAKRTPVEYAGRELDTVMITGGLESGELVVTVGSAKLTEGLWVKTAGES
ncbi:MAG: efflux RND transporter periplasmic adaptor subunit [Pseudomonadota bacterium]